MLSEITWPRYDPTDALGFQHILVWVLSRGDRSSAPSMPRWRASISRLCPYPSWRYLSASDGVRACPDGAPYVLIISRHSILQCARRDSGHAYKSWQCPLYPFVVLLRLLLQKLLIVRTLCPDMLCLYVPPLVLLHAWVFGKAYLLLCICVMRRRMCFPFLGCE